jgi:hypothetical protein
MAHGIAKGAEFASGLGAIVLGAGLALLAPQRLQSLAVPLLVVGILMHGVGMTLKMRLESAQGGPLWWERALFWLCWAGLAPLSVWLVLHLFGT